MPGNLFYAYVGRYVGFSELVLQLGSQYAHLAANAKWDPKEDTRMINFAYQKLSHPLDRKSFCKALWNNPSVFKLQSCDKCDEIGQFPIR